MMALQLSEDRISLTERRNEIIAGLHALPGQIAQVLGNDGALKAMAQETLKVSTMLGSFYHILTPEQVSRSLLIMGRGYQNATCLEGALKIKEISYMHSEGWYIITTD
jgi:glutamine---fructose-6-phosphate transaminase (isomerizing)